MYNKPSILYWESHLSLTSRRDDYAPAYDPAVHGVQAEEPVSNGKGQSETISKSAPNSASFPNVSSTSSSIPISAL